LIFNLYKIQILDGNKNNEQVLSQTKGYSLGETNRRGSIFFKNHRDNKTAVALQNILYTVAINPKYVKDAELFYEKISDKLTLKKDDFMKKAKKKNDPYEEIAHKIPEEKIKEIQKLELKGLIFVRELWRYYPFNEISSKIIGFTDFKGRGVYGLEKYYENILKRKKIEEDSNIFFSLFSKDENNNLFSKKIISREGNLISSIDVGLSHFVENTLREIDDKYSSKYSGAIIIKPMTGELITMTDSETFNLNSDRKDFRNRFVEHRFEVGSIFKPLVATLGLDSGKIKNNFMYDDLGCVEVLNRTICNFDKVGRGKNTSLQTIISQSLNTGMIEIEKQIGHKTFLRYLLKLGLAEETGIDLPHEIASNISNLINGNNDVDYATAAFGQGVSFTPMGIVRALATIANGGFLVTPHIVSKINYGGLIPDTDFIFEKKKIFSSSSVKSIKKILVARADKYAKNKKYFNKDYSVASKTGTAQIASPDGGYFKDKNLHTYFGFFPTEAPADERYAIFLYTVEPQDAKYSSQTMTEPFYKIVNFMIPYFKIKPDRVKIKL
jgi:cell division protein FtsI/penicillin-binding protein 2